MNATQVGTEFIEDHCTRAFTTQVKIAMYRGAEWFCGPQADSAVGLLIPGTNDALVIVYPYEQDMEVMDERLDAFTK